VTAPLRVLIADDDDLMRAGLKAVLSTDDTIEVAAEAADGRQAIHHTQALKPDVVLMDVRMPGIDGIAATREPGWWERGASGRGRVIGSPATRSRPE